MRNIFRKYLSHINGSGLVIGAIFFSVSLTPSLIPRDYLYQGLLGGFAFSIGYGFAVLCLAIWRFLELPEPSRKTSGRIRLTGALIAVATLVICLAQAAHWQNLVRNRVGMPDVDTAHPLEVGLIGIAVATLIIVTVLLLRAWMAFMAQRLYRIVPRRISLGIGVVMGFVIVAMAANGILFRGIMAGLDEAARLRDLATSPDIVQPEDPMATGSAASLIDWNTMGNTGRDFVASGPSREDIASFTGQPAKQPIRVYAGLNSAKSDDERAELALQELIRVGGFDRSVLVVVTPTGTGWMDPAAMDTLDYLHHGDVATVAIQYSYLSSVLSLLVQPEGSVEAGQALFRKIYGHWAKLPEDDRPRIYLFGISLGSYGSALSFRVYDILQDPIDGALWAGPPFLSPAWRDITAERNPGSPAWRPIFGDSSLVRFTNQENALDIPGATWGNLRIVYLQHASDPIVFFEPSSFHRRPEWMNDPRGPDVAPEFQWYPAVTFLQLLTDMANALVTPPGYGHLYAHEDYIHAWNAVTEPPGWDEDQRQRLVDHFEE